MQKRNPQIRPDEYEFVKDKRHAGEGHRHDGVSGARASPTRASRVLGVRCPGRHRQYSGDQQRAGGYRPRHHLRRGAPARAGGVHRQRHPRTASSRARTRSARPSTIEGNPYEVVGVAKALGSVFGNSQDNFVMIPIESYFKTYGNRNGHRAWSPKPIDQQQAGGGAGRGAGAAALLPPSAAGAGR